MPVKIQMVHLYHEVSDLTHYVGAAAFVDATKYRVGNPLIVLYGSNPIPPKHDAHFKAILALSAKYVDEYGFLKPGDYTVRDVSKGDNDAFYTIKVPRVDIEIYASGLAYPEAGKALINITMKNIGGIPVKVAHISIKPTAPGILIEFISMPILAKIDEESTVYFGSLDKVEKRKRYTVAIRF